MPVNALLPKVTPLEPVPEIDPTVSVRVEVPPITNPPVESLLVIVPEMVLLAMVAIVLNPAESAIVKVLANIRPSLKLSVVALAPRRVTVPLPRAKLLLVTLSLTLSRVNALNEFDPESANAPAEPLASRLSVREPLETAWPKLTTPLVLSVIARLPPVRFTVLPALLNKTLKPSTLEPPIVPVAPTVKSPPTVMPLLPGEVKFWIPPIVPLLIVRRPVLKALFVLAMTVPPTLPLVPSVKPSV